MSTIRKVTPERNPEIARGAERTAASRADVPLRHQTANRARPCLGRRRPHPHRRGTPHVPEERLDLGPLDVLERIERFAVLEATLRRLRGE